MKLLGIDYGVKRVGLAVGDTESRVAVPLETLEMGDGFWERLIKLAQDENIEEIVVGLPLALRDSGARGESARQVREFIEELKTRVPLSVHEEDERFSTALAERLLKGVRGSRDAVAAAAILQNFLDRDSKHR